MNGVVAAGEVHTSLLQNSVALPQSRGERVLASIRGEGVRRFERPMPYVVSPDVLTGVDCRLPSASGTRVRGIGTVACHAAITGGHVLQVSAAIRVAKSAAGRRLPWSHYLARPGWVEVVGKADRADLAQGFVAGRSGGGLLDLGAIGARVMDTIQMSADLDRRPPLLAPRAKLRWTAEVVEEEPDGPVRVWIEQGQVRAIHLTCAPDQVRAIAEFCEDVALHDWLLTTVLHLIRRSRIGTDQGRRAVHALRPAVDHLLHLWMPAARLDESVAALWESLERRPGLGRQWSSSVNRVRDQITLSTISLLSLKAREETG